MGSRTGSPTRAASPRRSPVKAVAKKTTPKKKKAVKKPAAHPTYKEMIMAAVVALKQKGGSSRQAISKYIAGHYKVRENSNVHLNMAIKRALSSGMLISAAKHAGTFRLSKAALTPAKPKKRVTAKKPAAKKAKKPKKKAAPKKKATVKKAKKKTSTKKKASTKTKRSVKSAKKSTTKGPAKKVKRAPAKKAKK